jgi:phage gpG-like protein
MKASISVDIRAEAVIARFRHMGARMHDALLREITRLSVKLQAKVKDQKLTGQVLHVRTGTLRRSINRVVEDRGEVIKAQVGTNVPYAHIHEYGFNGIESVRAHVRRSPRQMAMARYRTNKLGERIEIKGSYNKAGGGEGEINVRAHARHMVMPERSFLRSALADMEDEIRTDIRRAAREGLAA